MLLLIARNENINLGKIVNIDTPTYGNLLLCMIPNDTVSSDIIDKIMLWLMTHYHNCEEKKILCLIQWLGGKFTFIK